MKRKPSKCRQSDGCRWKRCPRASVITVLGLELCERHFGDWCSLREADHEAVDIAVANCPDLKQHEIRHLERMSKEPITTEL